MNDVLSIELKYGNRDLLLLLLRSLKDNSNISEVVITFNDIFEDVFNKGTDIHYDISKSNPNGYSKFRYEESIKPHLFYLWISIVINHFQDTLNMHYILNGRNIRHSFKYNQQFNINEFLQKRFEYKQSQLNKLKDLKEVFNLYKNINELDTKIDIKDLSFSQWMIRLHEL